MFCSRCGFKNAEGAQFCKNCGAQMGQQGVATGGAPVGDRRQAGVASGSPSGHSSALGGANARLIKVAVCAVVLVIVGLVAFVRLGSSVGCSTSVQLTQKLSDFYNSCLASELDEKDVKKLCDEMVALMPDEVVHLVLKREGVTGTSTASSLVSDKEIGEMVSGFESFIGKVDVNCLVQLGDELGEDELNEINANLEKENLKMRAKAGNKLEMKMDIEALDDLPGAAKGEVTTQTGDMAGMEAVNIDGRWYLWIDSVL